MSTSLCSSPRRTPTSSIWRSKISPGINGTEGQGDYKDLILSINTSAGLGVQATPEPTTFVAMGLGLAGLGLLRKRMVKK